MDNNTVVEREHSLRESGLLKKKELALALGVSFRTIDHWVRARRIPYIKASARLNLYRLADVLHALERRKVRELKS